MTDQFQPRKYVTSPKDVTSPKKCHFAKKQFKNRFLNLVLKFLFFSLSFFESLSNLAN